MTQTKTRRPRRTYSDEFKINGSPSSELCELSSIAREWV